MREISQPPQIPERGAGVARCETQLVIPLLETRSESTAQQQSQEQQQQFETEKNWMVVERFRYEVELETREAEQEELLQQLLLLQWQLKSPAAPPAVWKSQLVIPLLETGSESAAQQQPQEQQQQFETEGQSVVVDAGKARVSLRRGIRDGSTTWLRN